MGTAQVIEPGRRLVLVDIENLVGGSRVTAVGRVEAAFEKLEVVAGLDRLDLVFAAAGGGLALTCGLVRPDITLWLASGRDGAERRLMHEVPVEFVVERADRLVIASGDHLFVDYAVAARDAGLEVTVVGPRRGIHHSFWNNGF